MHDDLPESAVHRMARKVELTCQPHHLIALHVSQLCKCESVVLKWGIMQGQVPDHQGSQTQDSALCVCVCVCITLQYSTSQYFILQAVPWLR